MAVIFLFIDGVGLGEEAKTNPFVQSDFRGFPAMAGEQPFTRQAQEIGDSEHQFRQVDATLGVEGLPQSGTGQTTLFSGENAPKEIGRHFGPFAHSAIKHLLKEESLFIKAKQRGKSCQFVNAYPDIFFEKAEKRGRWSCTTLMTKSAGIALNTVQDVREGRALTAEITQQAWRERLDIEVPGITPEEGADRLLDQASEYDLLLHEYYLTDKAGHSQQEREAAHYLNTYDRFLWHLIRNTDRNTTLVLSSDHGNVEDLSIRTHTRNKVPLFAYGKGAPHFSEVDSIAGITPAILNCLGE